MFNIKSYLTSFIEYFREISYYNEFIAARKYPYFSSDRFSNDDLPYQDTN